MRLPALCATLVLLLGLAACGGGGGGGSSTFVPPPGPNPLIYVTDSGNAIIEFNSGLSGNVSPAAQISGSNTQLNSATAITRDSTGRIFVAQQSESQVLGFSQNVTGNASPLVNISGANTQLSTPTALAFDSGGRLFVANAGTSSITIYAANANGNVAPAAVISGGNTGLEHHFLMPKGRVEIFQLGGPAAFNRQFGPDAGCPSLVKVNHLVHVVCRPRALEKTAEGPGNAQEIAIGPAQRENRHGTWARRSSDAVTPPRAHSRTRLCP